MTVGGMGSNSRTPIDDDDDDDSLTHCDHATAILPRTQVLDGSKVSSPLSKLTVSIIIIIIKQYTAYADIHKVY